MLVVSVRLDRVLEVKEEDEDAAFKALGTELEVFIPFLPPDGSTSAAARMSKMQLCRLFEAVDVDLDLIPRRIAGPKDLRPIIRAIEGKRLTARTRRLKRVDTNEVYVEVYSLEAPETPAAVLH